MNNNRRKEIEKIQKKLAEALENMALIASEIEDIIGEEQDYFDNMPESLQGSEKGQASESAIDALEEVKDSIEALDLDEINGSLEMAIE